MDFFLMQSYKAEYILHLLQSKGFVKHTKQLKQIHSIIIIQGHLFFDQSSNTKLISIHLLNNLMRAYLKFGYPQSTLILFKHMLGHAQIAPNFLTFPTLIKASCCFSSHCGRALHVQAYKRGVLADPFNQTSLVNFYAQTGKICDAHQVFNEISNPCVIAYNAMIDAFCKNGEMGYAVSMFNTMPERDVISWTSVIHGFCSNGFFGEAIGFFRKMMVDDDVMTGLIKPNEATYVTLLSSCANLHGRIGLLLGKLIHGYMIRKEAELSASMVTALVDLYGKAGCLQSAVDVFHYMGVKGVCTWNAMIASLACNGREFEALDLFEKMKLARVYPTRVTFVALLTSCARAKLLETGFRLYRSMKSDFGIEPTMEHYGCMVDLLGRAGLLREAVDFVENMPFEADASVLGALLGACKIHGDIDLGNLIGRKLCKLQPWHCGQYVLLSSIYAGKYAWMAAADIRKGMAGNGIKKVPAYSVV